MGEKGSEEQEEGMRRNEKGEIIGFEHWDFEEFERYVWNYKTWKREGRGKKFVRKYRRCVMSELDDEWKVTTNYVSLTLDVLAVNAVH